MICTRPNIAYSTGLLAQHAANPGDEHWMAIKRELRYLQGTRDLGITYSRSKPAKLVGYVDADYAGDKNSSRPHRWVFLMAGPSWSRVNSRPFHLEYRSRVCAAASAAR
ncbi:hypothetical protein OPQ81_002588 [Rhizoctonia solani]|nr:hypothetical protein OPQ81_002588 [Rhizoctonia solani]